MTKDQALWSKNPQTHQRFSLYSRLANLALPPLKEIIIHLISNLWVLWMEIVNQELHPQFDKLEPNFHQVLKWCSEICDRHVDWLTLQSLLTGFSIAGIYHPHCRKTAFFEFLNIWANVAFGCGCRELLSLCWQLLSPPGWKAQVNVTYSLHECNYRLSMPFTVNFKEMTVK